MAKVDIEISEEALATMRERGEQWAAYRNEVLDSAQLGHVTFLRYGEGCTYKTPPQRLPDTPHVGVGWRYVYKGDVNLETGEVHDDK